MDVAADLAEVALFLDEMPLETPLKKMPAAAMPPVEVAGIAAAEILHPGREVRLGRLHEQVLVVRHEDERVQPPSVGFHRPSQPIEASVPVGIVTDDCAAFVSS